MIEDDEVGRPLPHDFGERRYLAGADERCRPRMRDIDDLRMDDRQIDRTCEAKCFLKPRLGCPACRAVRRAIGFRSGLSLENRHDNNRPAGALHAASVSRIRMQPGFRSCLAEIQSAFPARLLRIEHLDRMAGHDRGYGVLVDELRMPVSAQEHAKIVKRRNDTCQFHAIDQEDRQGILALSYRVKKQVL
jgi:hypothetical protein